MIATTREVDTDWSAFESYTTNLYARTLLTGQPSYVSAAFVPSTARQEMSQAKVDANAISQDSISLDVKAINDEMTSIRKVIGDLRVHAEEVRSYLLTLQNKYFFFLFGLVDESMSTMDDGCYGTRENVQRTKAET